MYLDDGSFQDSASTPPSESTMVLVPLPTRQRLFSGGDFVVVAAVVNSEKVVADGRFIETESVVVLSSVQLPPSISVASYEREREREREGFGFGCFDY